MRQFEIDFWDEKTNEIWTTIIVALYISDAISRLMQRQRYMSQYEIININEKY